MSEVLANVVVLDTETTGLLPPLSSPMGFAAHPKVIDIGAVKCALYKGDNGNLGVGKEIDRFQTLVDPLEPIPRRITKITGIHDSDVKEAPPFSQVWPGLRAFLQDARFVFAHNAAFDYGVLAVNVSKSVGEREVNWLCSSLCFVCTVEMFEPIWGRRPKLTELYEYVLGKPLFERHRALSDAQDLAEILQALGPIVPDVEIKAQCTKIS